ncbi:MAG: hypothetical protein ACRENO_02310 [Thermodesulfobacteriota bacterium]
MNKIEKHIKELLELRKENNIDPFNFSLLKYASWESSLRARLKEHADYVTPKIVEIISEVLESNIEKDDLEQIALIQLELTKKYAGKLLEMDHEINNRVEQYLELYNEALERIIEEEKKDDDEIEYN